MGTLYTPGYIHMDIKYTISQICHPPFRPR